MVKKFAGTSMGIRVQSSSTQIKVGLAAPGRETQSDQVQGKRLSQKVRWGAIGEDLTLIFGLHMNTHGCVHLHT